ncbi:hypothetical protein PHPALM_31478 [Phytophthora palmivora]|uniref:Chromo domain-containing protein n=1 Tax=Phytophthora palmivora TaxID=4796 RepID=A0A2P4X2G2_9STRA|nr:hypothetical protein PHPALM_31478 [Phytophthora palmivora]
MHFQALYAEVIDRKERKRLTNMARANGRTCNFVCGDYVVWSRVDKRLQGDKRLVRWVGPFHVRVHVFRLKHYSDAGLYVTEELRLYISPLRIMLGVRAIEQHHYDPPAAEWQLYVAWRGLDDSENSWEPFASIYAHAPALVRAYVEDCEVWWELNDLLQ